MQVPTTLARALLVHQFPPPGGPGVTAIADSDASHILIRHEDAHILHEVHYTRPDKPPSAVLTTANGASIASIGQGILAVGGLSLGAFVFADDKLANNSSDWSHSLMPGVLPALDRTLSTCLSQRMGPLYWEAPATASRHCGRSGFSKDRYRSITSQMAFHHPPR